jgi:hypothetical protein
MPRPISSALAIAVGLAFAPGLALAQDVLGTITARLGETEMTWFITAEGGESQSAIAKMPGVPLYDVSLWGNPADTDLAAMKGALLIDFSAMAAAGSANALEPTLQYLEEGYSGGWVAGSDDVLQVTLTRFEQSGTSMALAGNFAATAAYSDDLMAMTTDSSRNLAVSGAFEALLPLP